MASEWLSPLTEKRPMLADGGTPLPDYPIDVRWADMDALNHVNNVKYVEFTDSARLGLATHDDRLGATFVPLCEIDYLTALESRTDPAYVASALFGDELLQEVRSIRDGSTIVHATIRTVLAASDPFVRDEAGRESLHWVRATDGWDGVLSNVSIFGTFQEARILATERGPSALPHERIVVARNSVRILKPVAIRSDPYLVSTRLKRLGTASVELSLQLCDAGRVLAEGQAIVVGFDQRTGRSRPLTDSERTALRKELAPRGAV